MPKRKKSLLLIKETQEQLLENHREKIKSFKAKMDSGRTLTDKLADFMTESFGTVRFLSFNALCFGIWIFYNTGIIPGITVFDPFPFGLLTTIMSIEAIILATIVLISQNRAAHIADLREEIDLQINVRAEHEITKMIRILDEIHDHLGLPPEDDEELADMKKKTNLDEIEQEIIDDIGGKLK